jgi:ELWxxDGT repeat protein
VSFTWTPTADQVGSHSLTLRVTDNGSPTLFAEQVVSVTVEAIPNQAPVLTAIGNQTISEHLPFTFTATASDADAGQTLTFSLANGTSGAIPAGATINPTTGVFTWTPIEAQGPGTFTFDVVVTDNGSAVLTDRETLTVTVTEANAAPVLLRGSVPIGQVDSPLTPVGPVGRLISEIADLVPPTGGADSVSDSDAGAVTGIAISLSAGLPLWYSLDNGTTWVGFSPSASNVRLLAADASTRLFVSPPSIDFAGSRLNEFTFQAWDRTVGSNGGVITTGTLTGTGPTGAFSSSFAQATVIFIEDQVTNQAPVLAAIGNQTIDEGQPLSFTATASDPNAGQTLAFSLANGTSGLVPLGASINPTTGAFSWTPTEAQGPGTFTFDVVVTDNGSPALSDRETITITVTEANAAPVLNVVATPTLVVDEDAPGPVGAVGTLISTLVDMNPPAGGLDNVTDLDAAAVTGVAIVGRNSSFNWFYSLNGGSSWTAFGSAGQGPSSALLLAADSLTRIYAQPNVPNMTGSDFFGFDFRAWDQTSGTNGGTVNTAGAIGGAGTFSVNVDSVRVTINSANDAPVLSSIGSQSIDEGQLLTFTATANDPDAGQMLTFSLANGTSGQIPAGASINPTTGAFAWTPTESQGPGTFTFDVVVTDNGSPNLSDRETLTVTVGDVNQQPTLDPIAAQTVTAGQLLSFTAVGSDTDVPANSLTYSLQGTVPAGASIDPNTGVFSWTPTADQVGSHSLTLRVTDNGSPTLFAEQVVNITVSSSNQAPIALNDAFSIQESSPLIVGTSLVKDIAPGLASSTISRLVTVGDRLFFAIDNGSSSTALWTSDGTAAGTVLVKDDFVGTATSGFFGQLVDMNGTLFFKATNSVNGTELWKSDGTLAGTQLVKDIQPGIGDGINLSAGFNSAANVNGTLYFVGIDATTGFELWKSDGTEAGTVLVKDIVVGGSSRPSELTNVNGTLFFVAQDNVAGSELFKSDGTAAGTVVVKDINVGGFGSNPRLLTNVNGTLFFVADDAVNGIELWKSDGTAAGTVLVKNITAGSGTAGPGQLTSVGGRLFFTVDDGVHSSELWTSDGTEAGTVLVKDIVPGGGTSLPQNLINVNDTLFFSANDGVNGSELWKSDGTEAGTVLVKDIIPGAGGSIGTVNFWQVAANSELFLSAARWGTLSAILSGRAMESQRGRCGLRTLSGPGSFVSCRDCLW